MDGIDFDIEGGINAHWDDLARFLSSYRKPGNNKVYMGAAPQCPFPDAWIGGALKTGQYSSRDLSNRKSAIWKPRTSIPAKRIFLGLPAAGSGFFPSDHLTKQVLPVI